MMHRRRRTCVALLGAVLLAAGCEGNGAGTILELDAAGDAGVLAYLDRNGNGEPDASLDSPAVGVPLFLVRSLRDTVATATTGQEGTAVLARVPVGDYRLLVDPIALGDSLEVGMTEVRVAAAEPVLTSVALLPRVRTVEEARTVTAGRLFAIHGLALHGGGVFGDGTVHVADSTGAIRAIAAVPADGVTAGDSVRVLGRAGVQEGVRVVLEAQIFVRGEGILPTPVELGTGSAARGGDDADLQESLVRITDGTVLSVAQTPAGDVRLVVDDGSGLLEVLLDRDAGIVSESPLLAGVVVDVTGLLAPAGPGVWRLKPRASADFAARVPRASLREARALGPGRLVSVEGVALNGWATFGDASLHLADSTGALRALQVNTASIFAGDSVRLVGITAVHEGQTVMMSLQALPPTILARVMPPKSRVLRTSEAAAADAGGADAALVTVREATIQEDTATVGGDFRFFVNDGSGLLLVVLDRDAGIGSTGLLPGTLVDLSGVLIPLSGGRSWFLKPRGADDIKTGS